MEKRIVYIYDDVLVGETRKIKPIGNRSQVVHDLICAYDLLSSPNVTIRPSFLATVEDLKSFHASSYIDCIEQMTSEIDEDDSEIMSDDEFNVSAADKVEEFGLGYDCPLFPGIENFCRRIVGGTLAAAEALIEGNAIAINWFGGWHHAQRSEASGFCYVNDIVIGIQRLLQKFPKVLYIDLDAHHGDGVENAFIMSKKVMTVSFHNYEAGFFPGSGNFDENGEGRGKYFAVNVPLKNGLIDDQFSHIFDSVMTIVQERFSPDVFVVQCGTDCVAGDPLGTFNLTEKSIISCAKQILRNNTPTMFLGGGGYNVKNSAIIWTHLMAIITDNEVKSDIPDHDNFLLFSPDFCLSIPQTLRKNHNDEAYLSSVINKIAENLANLPKL